MNRVFPRPARYLGWFTVALLTVIEAGSAVLGRVDDHGAPDRGGFFWPDLARFGFVALAVVVAIRPEVDFCGDHLRVLNPLRVYVLRGDAIDHADVMGGRWPRIVTYRGDRIVCFGAETPNLHLLLGGEAHASDFIDRVMRFRDRNDGGALIQASTRWPSAVEGSLIVLWILMLSRLWWFPA